ncbi:chemotaxis protein CheW, partial [uncultured Abyssibacter sp.]|uniref:chemotaxis protein CheW n=1 Tax=uncultured Abyssibacter sp. TaxID=2320202 RepID=UPI0032B26766
ALMVTVSGREFAIPVTAIEEVSRFDSSRVECMSSREVIRRDQDVIALIRMEHWVGRPSGAEEQHCVVVDVGRERRALLVDDVPGREEIVVKPLGKMMGGLAGIAGASVTGDGGIALVLDLPGLLNQVSPAYASTVTAIPRPAVAASAEQDIDLELF